MTHTEQYLTHTEQCLNQANTRLILTVKHLLSDLPPPVPRPYGRPLLGRNNRVPASAGG